MSLQQSRKSRSCTDPRRRLYSNTGRSKHDTDHVWLLNPPRWTRCRDCPAQVSTFSSRVGQGCGAMRAGCVICMQLQLLPLQNSNARFRPCSVKLNIELYYGCNCAPRCHLLAKLKPHHNCHQALNVILHRCAVSSDCQQFAKNWNVCTFWFLS